MRGLVGLLTIPFLIRFLGLQEYGVWSLAFAVLALMTMGEAGISVAAAVFLSKDLVGHDVNETSRTLTVILVSAVFLAMVLGLSLWLAGPLIVRPLAAFGSADRATAGRALQIAGVAVSVLILQRTLVGVEQAFDRYAAINVLELCQSLLVNLGLVVVAWTGGTTVHLMKWQVVACTLILGGHGWVVFQLLRNRGLALQWSAGKAGQIFRYSVDTWTATLGSAAFSQCDRLIVGGVLGAPPLGIYSAITGITSRINSFSGTAVQPLVPSLSRDMASNAPAYGRIREAIHLNALLAIQAGVFLYVLADWVMPLLVPAATTLYDVVGLQISAVIYTLYSLNAPGFYILFSIGQARINAGVTLSSGLACLVFIYLGASHFGLLGALAGNAGYLGTLVLVSSGVRRVGIVWRQYLSWMGFPFLLLATALAVGLVLKDHLWWRAGFIALQAAIFTFWFFRTQACAKRMSFDVEVRQST